MLTEALSCCGDPDPDPADRRTGGAAAGGGRRRGTFDGRSDSRERRRYLADAPLRRSGEAIRADAIALAGKYESRLGDLAADHDRYLAEDLGP